MIFFNLNIDNNSDEIKLIGINLPFHSDIPALDALNDIVCEYKKDYTAFVLQFHFDENEYFYNKVREFTLPLSIIKVEKEIILLNQTANVKI